MERVKLTNDDVVIGREYWIKDYEEEQFKKFRDILYCKYAIREEMNNRNCTVDMKGIEYWANKLEELRKDFEV